MEVCLFSPLDDNGQSGAEPLYTQHVPFVWQHQVVCMLRACILAQPPDCMHAAIRGFMHICMIMWVYMTMQASARAHGTVRTAPAVNQTTLALRPCRCLCMQTGEPNPRIQASAHDLLVRMATVKQLNMASQLPLVLKPMRNQAAWRPVLGRLKLLAALIPLLGIAKGGAEGVPVDSLMKFVGAAFSSPNADVRATALSVALQVRPG